MCVCVCSSFLRSRQSWLAWCFFFVLWSFDDSVCGMEKKATKKQQKTAGKHAALLFFFPRQASTSNAHAHARLHFGTTPRNKFRNKIVANGTLVRLKQTNKQTNKQNRSFRLTNPDRKKKKLSSSIGRALWKIKSCRPIRCSRPSATPRPPVTTTRPVS